MSHPTSPSLSLSLSSEDRHYILGRVQVDLAPTKSQGNAAAPDSDLQALLTYTIGSGNNIGCCDTGEHKYLHFVNPNDCVWLIARPNIDDSHDLLRDFQKTSWKNEPGNILENGSVTLFFSFLVYDEIEITNHVTSSGVGVWGS